jgi:hypothetical protein
VIHRAHPLWVPVQEEAQVEGFEVAAMIIALSLMSAAVGVKILTAQLIGHMNHQISQVAHTKAEALGRLKMVQSQKSVGDQNKAALTTKKTRLTKKTDRLKREMGDMKDQEDARRQRTGMRKVD